MRDQEAQKHDKEFFTHFGMVLASLVVFMLVCVWIARTVAPSRTELTEAINSPEAIDERIKPAGQLLTDASELTAELIQPAQASPPPSQTPAPFGGSLDGKMIYEEVCQLCHASGLAGAPIPGDKQAWSTRKAQGIEALYLNSLNGIRAMPARGGRPDLSDEQLKASVDYMLSVP